MASWTDAIPKFNPYIEQLPVQEMVNVGVEKQRRYDEGVQKIQTNIDSVAGLSVSKDIHKQYLQSKLNQLGNNLKTVAAGDFSNFQLVNSVSGMASQIAKDPVIQNAVYSTKVIQKGQQDMEVAKKAGKSSPNNEAFWNQQVSAWGNDGNLNSTFNGSFIEHTDVDKKLRDIADKIHASDSTIDNPFKRDSNGNTLYFSQEKVKDKEGKSVMQTTASTDPSKGQKEVDLAMLKTTIKGRPAEKILANFYDSLDDNDQRQLGIDAWAHYRGVGKEAFAGDIQNNYEVSKKLLQEDILNSNLELQTNTKLTAEEKSALQAKVNTLTTKSKDGSMEADLQDQISALDNPQTLESYKYKVYSQKYLTNLAKDISDLSYQQEIVSNPYKQAEMESQRLQLAQEEAAKSQWRWEQTFTWDKQKFSITQAEKKRKEEGDAPVTIPGRISTEVDVPTLGTLQQDINNITGVYKDGKMVTPGAIGELNAKYAPIIPAIKDKSAEEKKKYLDGLASSYTMNPDFINTQTDRNVKEYLKERRAYDIIVSQKNSLYASAVEDSSKFSQEYETLLGNESGVNINGGARYSAKDLFEFRSTLSKYEEIIQRGLPGVSSIGPGRSSAEFSPRKLLEATKGTKFEALSIAYSKSWEQRSPLEKVMVNSTEETFKKFKGPLSEVNKRKQEAESKFLADRMPERQTMSGTLHKDNVEDMRLVDELITNKGLEFFQGGLDSNKKKDYSPDNVAKLTAFKNEKDTRYTLVKKYGGAGELIISTGSGTVQQKITLTPTEFSTYFPKYSRSNPISDIKYNVLSSPGKTTNTKGVTDGSSAVTAGLTGYDIPQLSGTAVAPLVRMDVTGSPFNDGSGNDKYVVTFYVNNNGTWISRVLNDEYVNDAGLQSIIGNIGTNTIDSVLNPKKE